MKYAGLAVVIPTLNEEYYIGSLLDSLALQTIQPNEIVVVDAYSNDNTIREAEKRRRILPQIKTYQIPKYSISRQRNFGARQTHAKDLIFIDADMRLCHPHTLENYLGEVLAKCPDIAAAKNLPDSKEWKDRLYFSIMDVWMKGMKPFWPVVPAQNLYVKRSIFEFFNGFDEQVFVGEDCEMVQRMTKAGAKFIFLKSPEFYHSVRRFRKEGRTRYLFKVIKAYMDVRKYGYRQYQMDYEFGNFGRDC